MFNKKLDKIFERLDKVDETMKLLVERMQENTKAYIIDKYHYYYEKLKTKTIYTNKGDTLWNIALDEKENNKYYKDKNIREIVYDIKQINNMQDSIILPGETLKIYYK